MFLNYSFKIMAHITLQFGQCGNQLGGELFSLAFHDTTKHANFPYWTSCSRDSWFSHTPKGNLKARAVLVDSESKVLSSIQMKNSPWTFSLKNVVSGNSGGAGNNFALGYSVIGPQLKDPTLEILRRECEKCDRVRGLISLGSCAGGTGSGAGTYILEHIRDFYPQKNLISVLVMPYFSGEVVTQNNNMLFTISRQNDICDALVTFENDMISHLVNKQFQMKNTAFIDLNKIISQNLLAFLQPIKLENSLVDLYDLISQLCPDPRYKFISIQSFPLIKEAKSKFDTPPSWTTLERDVLRTMKTSLYFPNIDFINAYSNVVICRGLPAPDNTVKKLKSIFFLPDWVPPNSRFHHYHQPRQLLNLEKCLTLVSNNAKVCGLIDSCISKAWKSFTNDMYVHHYYKFGFTKDNFLEAFNKSESILKAYNNLQ